MADAALGEVAAYHNDVVSALELYFSFGRRPGEIAPELTAHLEETNRRSSFAVLTRLERAFRVDYEYRCRKRLKDSLSKAFCRMYKEKKTRVRLSEDIFEAWKENGRQSRALRELVAEMRTALKFRDWIAHGRYWVKPTGKHDFNSIYLLAENVLNAFPLREPD
jgi:hypothetical protein